MERTKPPIRVLIAADHAMVRRGMRDFLGLHGDLEVVAEPSTAPARSSSWPGIDRTS